MVERDEALVVVVQDQPRRQGVDRFLQHPVRFLARPILGLTIQCRTIEEYDGPQGGDRAAADAERQTQVIVAQQGGGKGDGRHNAHDGERKHAAGTEHAERPFEQKAEIAGRAGRRRIAANSFTQRHVQTAFVDPTRRPGR
jgi:hypothetical protein